MEIKVGEYVRLARNQGIRKIVEIDEDRYILDDEIASDFGEIVDYLYIEDVEDDIVKHSKNIIDLIEVGDYVNGWKVFKTNKQSYLDYAVMVIDGAEDGTYVFEYEIKSILTHEQMERMEYKV